MINRITAVGLLQRIYLHTFINIQNIYYYVKQNDFWTSILPVREYEKQRVQRDSKWYFNKRKKKHYACDELAKCIDLNVEDAKAYDIP